MLHVDVFAMWKVEDLLPSSGMKRGGFCGHAGGRRYLLE